MAVPLALGDDGLVTAGLVPAGMPPPSARGADPAGGVLPADSLPPVAPEAAVLDVADLGEGWRVVPDDVTGQAGKASPRGAPRPERASQVRRTRLDGP